MYICDDELFWSLSQDLTLTIERKSVTLVTKIATDIDREKFQISSIQNQKREIEQASCTNTNIKPEQDGLPRFTMANHVKPNN